MKKGRMINKAVTLGSRIGTLKSLTLSMIAGAVFATASTYAATNTWNVAGGGDWDTTTANWTTDGGATTTTFTDDGTVDAIFDKTQGGTIAISADISPLSTTVSAASGTYSFSETVNVTVHYETLQSLKAKLDLYSQRPIRGVAYWRISQEPDGFWER